ncbi:hypothetical protein I4U23_024440 [Adineta vaga]|nr:hypothetical protein I4U23_024440 [Adineta vaga]
MDPSFDIPCEPRLSNSIFKNRPVLNPNRKIKPNVKEPIAISSNDTTLMNVTNNPVEKPTMNSENDVIFRVPSIASVNRINNLTSLSKIDAIHRSISFNPSNTTLFYITSSTPDDNSMTYSNSSITSDQPSLSERKNKKKEKYAMSSLAA